MLDFGWGFILFEMKFKQTIFFQLIIVFVLSACSSSLPIAQQRKSVRINVGAGPEDMVLDTLSMASARLLVSCTERRKNAAPYGEICEVDLRTDSYKIMRRLNEPQGTVFYPHGIDLVKSLKGEILLYCVSHNNEKKENSIIIYKVLSDHLEFKEKLDSPFLVSPNDITADCTGEIFVTNDAHKHGSSFEQLFKLKTSNVICYQPENQKWTIIANKFSYANGIALNHCPSENLLLSTTRGNKLYLLEKKENKKEGYSPKTIAKLKGIDNITFLNKNEILVPSHQKMMAVIRHYKSSKNYSPTVVYCVNINTGEFKAVYANDGSEISAGSTALFYNGKLYMSQIFDPFILKCDAEDLKTITNY